MSELYLFRTDLRLEDNPGLLEHARADSLLCVYCWPSAPAWCNLTGLGEQRERFLLESLQALHKELQMLGQGLLVLRTDPRAAIVQLVEQFSITRVGTSATPGYFLVMGLVNPVIYYLVLLRAYDLLPAQQRTDEFSWYLGTADAVYQNLDVIDS